MRIISQNGKVDMPYEKTVFYLACEQIVAKHEGTKYILATYSTEEKAIKAMEMCRKHYATVEYNRRIIPKGDTLVYMEIVKELISSCFIFQFPADDEI